MEEKEGAVSPWKIWADKKYAFPYLSEPVGQNWAGCRIALETDGDAVGIELIPSEVERLVDLWINGEFAQTKVLEAEKESLMFEKLESGEKRIELWIDQRSPSWVKGCLLYTSWMSATITVNTICLASRTVCRLTIIFRL